MNTHYEIAKVRNEYKVFKITQKGNGFNSKCVFTSDNQRECKEYIKNN